MKAWCSAVVFLICYVDVSMCSQKAKREKAAMHHRQLYLLVSGVLVLRGFNMFFFFFMCYVAFFFLILVYLWWSCISSQRLGLKGLTLNVTHSKTHRLNKNLSVQHHHHIVRTTQIDNIYTTHDRTVLKRNIFVEIIFLDHFFFKLKTLLDHEN